MRKVVFVLLLVMGKVGCMAQQLQCTVLEKDTHHPLDGMVVRAFAADGTMLGYTSSDEKGQFTLDLSKSPKTIKVAGLGYTTLSVTFFDRAKVINKIRNKDFSSCFFILVIQCVCHILSGFSSLLFN